MSKILAFALMGLLLAGCDKKTDSVATTPTTGPTTAPVSAAVASAHAIRARILVDTTDIPFDKKYADRLPFVEDVRLKLSQAGCEISDDDQKPCDIIVNIKQTKAFPTSLDGGSNWAKATVGGSIYITHNGKTIAEDDFRGYISIVLEPVPPEGAPYQAAYNNSRFTDIAARVIDKALEEFHSSTH